MWAYDFDASVSTIENRRTFIEVPEDEGVPDGATVDADGLSGSHICGAAGLSGMIRMGRSSGKSGFRYC